MSLSSHQSARMKNDEWLTPPEIVRALGPFDLDPCSPPANSGAPICLVAYGEANVRALRSANLGPVVISWEPTP